MDCHDFLYNVQAEPCPTWLGSIGHMVRIEYLSLQRLAFVLLFVVDSATAHKHQEL
jgi:hypothetical protein